MKNTLLFILLIFNCFLVQSQSKEVFGTEFTFKKTAKQYKWVSQNINIGNDDKYNYSLKYIFNNALHNVAPKVFIVKRDENYSIINEVRIDFNKKKIKFLDVDSYHLFAGKLIYLGKRKNKETKEQEVVIVEYDKNTFVEKNVKKIASLNLLINGEKASYSDLIVFDKKNKEKELLISVMGSSKGGRNINSIIVNEKLENIFETKMQLKNTKPYLKFEDVSFSHNIISYLVYENNYYKGEYHKTGYSHIYVSRKDKKFNVFDIVLNEEEELSAQSIINNNKINILGVIKNKKQGGKIFSSVYDAISEVNEGKIIQDIKEFLGSSESKLILTKIVRDNNGDFIILAEDVPPGVRVKSGASVARGKNLIRTGPTANSNVSNKKFREGNSVKNIRGESIISEGIVVARINRNGVINWVKKFNKYDTNQKHHYDRLTLIKDYDEYIQLICYSQTRTVISIKVNKKTGENENVDIFKESNLLGTDDFNIGTPIELIPDNWIIPFGNNDYKNKGILEIKFKNEFSK